MIKIVSPRIDEFTSQKEIIEFCQDPMINKGLLGDVLESKVKQFFANKPEFLKYCEVYAETKRLKPFAVLDAHGDDFDGVWKYIEGRRAFPVQSWIDRQDGKYGTLLIACCNPRTSLPKSRKSLVWFSNGDTILGEETRHESPFNFELYHPGEKKILDVYQVEDLLTKEERRKK